MRSEQGEHDRLRLDLMSAGRALAAATADPDAFRAALDDLVTFCVADLLPHLEADEGWLRAAESREDQRLLAQAIRSEARAMSASILELTAVTEPCEAVAATKVLHTLLAAHVRHEELLTGRGRTSTAM